MHILFYATFFSAFADAAMIMTSNATNAKESWTDQIYEQPPSTLKGCECMGQCTTSWTFYCDAQPFCLVKNENCKDGKAEWSLEKQGYYDWCTFEKYDEYEKLTAKEKSEIIQKHLDNDPTSSTYLSKIDTLKGLLGESVRVSFEASSDVFPEPRKKYIHSVGVVAPISFRKGVNHNYTGLFQGAKYGFARFSSADCPSASGGITPGTGIKLLRDGKPSANFVAMYKLDGQSCENGMSNFFEHTWKNHVPPTTSKGIQVMVDKFWQASNCPQMVGLSDVAATSDGSQAVFPFELELIPAMGLDVPCDDLSAALEKFGTLQVGRPLFGVSAIDSPGGSPQYIGDLVLEGKPKTSKFGDEALFFKHQYMEDDFALRPDWLDKIDKAKDCGMASVSNKVPDFTNGCSAPIPSPLLNSLFV